MDPKDALELGSFVKQILFPYNKTFNQANLSNGEGDADNSWELKASPSSVARFCLKINKTEKIYSFFTKAKMLQMFCQYLAYIIFQLHSKAGFYVYDFTDEKTADFNQIDSSSALPLSATSFLKAK